MSEANQWMPPFPALRAFHAAAQQGRFRSAAETLGVTESAISHQVRRLEDFLRVSLFERQGPKVRLTATGQRYFAEIDPAMARIQAATRSLIGPAERHRVVLTLPPSLTTLWLIPNLAGFETAHPEVDLQFVTTTRMCNLAREQIDLAIRHGEGNWGDVEADFLLAETTLPVGRPGLLGGDLFASGDGGVIPAGRVATALASCRLIVNGYYPDEWHEWAQARGIDTLSLDGALKLDSQDQVLQAAERGLGLAMGRRPMVDGHLAAGSLQAPFGPPDRSKASYYLCRPPGIAPPLAARRVARWLRALAEEPLETDLVDSI